MAEPRPDVGATSLTLLDRARANEADAWARLVTLYAPLVRHWCLAGGLQPNDVNDVVQEVCRVAFSGLVGFRRDRPGDTFRGWLRTITRTALALHFRKLARVPVAGGGSAAFVRLQEVADPCPTCWMKIPPTRSGGCIAAPWSWSAASSRIVPGRCSGSRPSKTASRPTSPPGSESPPWPSARPSRASFAAPRRGRRPARLRRGTDQSYSPIIQENSQATFCGIFIVVPLE